MNYESVLQTPLFWEKRSMIERIVTLGDSTMQFNNQFKYPQTGWPQALERFLRRNCPILNFAKNGRSTKSFIEQGLFAEALKEIKENDLVLIEFGHNDLKKEDPLRYTTAYGTYQSNLKYMVEEVQKKNAEVILLTSITERKFENGELLKTHGDYPQAMKDLAKQLDVVCIDLFEKTREVLLEEGEELSKRFYMNFEAGLYESKIEGCHDDTHLRYEGAYMVANCFYKEMTRLKLYPEIFITEA